MSYSFFISLAKSGYLSFFSLSFYFILWSIGTAKSTIHQDHFFLLAIIRSGRLAEIKWSVCISKSYIINIIIIIICNFYENKHYALILCRNTGKILVDPC